ncbi:hypothetical protein BJ322DRAFT_561924 [Thelephora terrestris]|uniref:Zn(2)-C6 fungal-type domain-containing protein n=1 Tax=Thelephora terrestris TaxID=56493 RepID=A0A9P6LAJ1_9AGAM|nr:hypothetical protein BJ322DRAFT_561924 [Thelephora terrestris]
MSAISAMSARYSQSDSDPEESSFFFPSSSSSSTSISTSASAYEFGVEAGIIPSATMLSTPFPIEAPAQHSSIPFVSAHARIAEFEQLREELRKTDIAREMQVERLNALVFQASYELPAVPQFGGSMMPTASIHGSQTGYHVVPERIPAVCHPIGDPFLPQFNQFDNYQQACALSAPMPTPMPTSSMVTPMPIQHLHYQPQQLLHATVTGVASPGFVTRGRVTKACEYCKFRKVKCSGGEPCERCTERAIQCVYERRKPRGPAKKRSEMRDVPVQQVSVSSASSMPRQIFDAPPAFSVAIPSHPHPRPSAIIPPPPLPSSASMRPTLLSSVPSLSRPLFSPPTPATPTLVNASGQVITPTASTFPQFDVAKPLPSANLEPSSTKSPRSSPEESAVSPIKPSSPERFSDEEILMTLKMPSDPSGTPSGFFDFLDPSQEASFPDEVEALSEKTPNLGSITDFETHLDPSRKMPGGEVVDKIRKKEPAEVKTLIMLAPPVVKRAPSMPTIVEEDEEEEEDGDVTITPTVAQRAFLPPDKFARPRSEPQTVAPAKVSEDPEDDSLETPRPRGYCSTRKHFLCTRSRPIRCNLLSRNLLRRPRQFY